MSNRVKDVTPEIWEELKEGTKLYDWFNEDNGEVILNGKTWWLETIRYGRSMPNDALEELQKLMLKKYGAKWLYQEV